jgi:hypothetical protein
VVCSNLEGVSLSRLFSFFSLAFCLFNWLSSTSTVPASSLTTLDCPAPLLFLLSLPHPHHFSSRPVS